MKYKRGKEIEFLASVLLQSYFFHNSSLVIGLTGG